MDFMPLVIYFDAPIIHITFPEFQLMILLLRKKKPTIGILVTQWFQFSTQFSSPWLCQLQQEQSHCHLFCLFFYMMEMIVGRI